MGSVCKNMKNTQDLKQIQMNCKNNKTFKKLKRADFQHPKQILDFDSSYSICSERNSSQFSKTIGHINTSSCIYMKRRDNQFFTRRVNSSLNRNSLNLLKKDDYNSQSDLSIELIDDAQLKLIIPYHARRSWSKKRVTTKVDLLKKVKNQKYLERFKRRKT
ncbi:unnamed protein product [Paramecium primaurelia]|uniref:Uncharacterized protein n=2 Tax=Paramecium TaxID=5884 RepID=A0A8S1SU08_9CILI|nr:unnamed protein product [Paramecium primaurelia]CAD8142876.1 unnamed protein product [Paramecium pentaurelia]